MRDGGCHEWRYRQIEKDRECGGANAVGGRQADKGGHVGWGRGPV